MLSDLVVAAAFRRYMGDDEKQQMVQCKYCPKAYFAKNTP